MKKSQGFLNNPSTHIRHVLNNELSAMRLTKLVIDKLPVPLSIGKGKTAQKRYYDDSLKGFGVRVTSGGTKAFYVEKLIGNKLRRITMGHYPSLAAEHARKEAQKLLGKIATGIDPVLEKRATKVRQIKLGEAFQDYVNTRKSLTPETLRNYHKVMNFAFKDWKTKPLFSISKDKIAKHHTILGAQHGHAYANLSMRVLRAIFNLAAGQYEDEHGRSLITENPVKQLSQTRAWYRLERRKTYIKSHELGRWHEGVMQVANKILRDYLLLLLFTGLRRQEAATLKWENVDLITKSLTILDTKSNQSHTLPLSDYLYELVKERRQKTIGDYVYPGGGAGGYIIEPRKQIPKVIESTGIQFMIHDLRRTFVTIAESLDISAYAVKRLVNHKMNNDVTAGYIMSDVERLRKPMEQISKYIVSKCLTYEEIKANPIKL